MANHLVSTGLSLDYYSKIFCKGTLTDNESKIVNDLNRLSRTKSQDEYLNILESYPPNKTVFQYLEDKRYFTEAVLEYYRRKHYSYSQKKIIEVANQHGWSCGHWAIWAVVLFCGNFPNIAMNDPLTRKYYKETVVPLGLKYSLPIFCNDLPDSDHQAVAVYLQTSYDPPLRRNLANYVFIEPQGFHVQEPGSGTALPIPGRAILYLPEKLFLDYPEIKEHLTLQKFQIQSKDKVIALN